MFNEYETEDGTVMVIQGELEPRRLVELPPTEEEISAAQQRATDAEEVVRELKDGQGLGNTVGCKHWFSGPRSLLEHVCCSV